MSGYSTFISITIPAYLRSAIFARLSRYAAGIRTADSIGSEPPLVSCVMATTQCRRSFLSQAVKYFQRQMYSPKELIVVDDPGEPACDAITTVPGIRYLQTNARLTVGSKLNLGIHTARGTIIQKLDDDDYYHPEFLSATVGGLRARKRRDSIVACASHLVLLAPTGELKVRKMAMWSGGTFCFFRELWRKCPYRDVSLAEDVLFLEDHESKLIGIDNPELYCYVRHAEGNLWRQFVRSEEMEFGPVKAGEDVTEYFRRLPAYAKSLKEYMPGEDLWFWESQIQEGYRFGSRQPG